MKLRTVIYTPLFATLYMGCGGRLSMRELERLEGYMNDAPDSVLTEIKEVKRHIPPICIQTKTEKKRA